MIKTKYPRTKHLPWSTASSKDDRYLQNTQCFENKKVLVTVKLDGENTTLYPDGTHHARSLDSKPDVSRDWLWSWWASKIHTEEFSLVVQSHPEIRFCVENLYAKHTIHYQNLPFSVLVHSVWDGSVCLDWTITKSICFMLGLHTVPVLYDDVYNEKEVRKFDSLTTYQDDLVEGYVLRNQGSFSYEDFASNVAKYVRPDFKVNEQHWFKQQRVQNGLIQRLGYQTTKEISK